MPERENQKPKPEEHVIGVLLKIAHFGSRGRLFYFIFEALKILKTGDLHPSNFDSSPSSHPACPQR